MAKATHEGECQICGRQQKLPAGRLSKHGYTKQWGFFAGVCPGAGHLPFELSKDLILGNFRNATADTAARLRAMALQTKAGERDASLTASRYYGFRNSQNRPTGYVQEVVTIKAVPADWDPTYTKAVLTYADGQPCQYGYGNYDAVLLQLRTQNADGLDWSAQQHENYVAWQDKRMANWKLQDLKPVKA